MKVYLLVADYGDGYSGIRFFRDEERALELLENDEEYYCNDEVTEIDVPDDFTPPGFWAD